MRSCMTGTRAFAFIGSIVVAVQLEHGLGLLDDSFYVIAHKCTPYFGLDHAPAERIRQALKRGRDGPVRA